MTTPFHYCYYYCQVSLFSYFSINVRMSLYHFQTSFKQLETEHETCVCGCACVYVFMDKEARLWVGGYDRRIILSPTLLYFGLIYDSIVRHKTSRISIQ